MQQDASRDVARTWSFSVGQVRDPYVPGYETANPGDRYVAVDITVRNVSGKVQQDFPNLLSVEDAAGHSWPAVSVAPASTGASFWWENLDPGATVHVTLRAEVPASAHGLELVWWPNPLAPKQRFPL